MNALERKHYSLAVRVLRGLSLHSLLLGLICFALGLGMYLNALMQHSMREAANTARGVLDQLCAEVDASEYTTRTYEVYRSWAETKPTEENGPEYYAAYAEIARDPGYQRMRELLREARTEEMTHNFLALADEETGALVFVVDTDPREGHEYPLGKIVKVPPSSIGYSSPGAEAASPGCMFICPSTACSA